jgi:hypothetical protein
MSTFIHIAVAMEARGLGLQLPSSLRQVWKLRSTYRAQDFDIIDCEGRGDDTERSAT